MGKQARRSVRTPRRPTPPTHTTTPSTEMATPLRDRPALISSPSDFSGSATLLPSDHVRMLVELLQPMGPELARRWVAALLLVDRDERDEFVRTIERHVADLYAQRADP